MNRNWVKKIVLTDDNFRKYFVAKFTQFPKACDDGGSVIAPDMTFLTNKKDSSIRKAKARKGNLTE
jgi:hypothetical protein